MTSADLVFKMKLLRNFQTNLDKSLDDKDIQKMLLNQAIRVVSEIDQAIKADLVRASDAVDLVVRYKLQPIMKKVRSHKASVKHKKNKG